ncbi:MAG: hypothetical protein OXM87_06855 [Truepera sp.]|nr:hypothetical protein [Truepera sp.]
MSESFPDQLEDLRAALLKLKATGAEGFEGLIAATLTEITGVPFRLAGGGRQFGVDAKPAYDSDSICFEAKRYDDPIPRAEILSKIAELSISDDSDTELWVLGATSPVTSQLAGTVRKLGQKNGISILILDWSVPVIPPLAVTLAMSETQAAAFLKRHVGEKGLAAKAVTALNAIRNSNAFEEHAERIRLELEKPTLGIGMAKRANIEWLTSVFSDRQKARVFLQQPLAPQDRSVGTFLTRDTLVNRLRPFLTCKPDDRIVTVLGDEGNGKSWLVAQSWLCLEEKPVMIVLAPDDFHQASPTGDLEGIVIGKLVQQTDDYLSEGVVNWWRRKLKRWRNHNAANELRLVVFVDGLNQRPEPDWARFMDALAFELSDVEGQLIVTAGTRYFRDWIERRLVPKIEEIEVPEWTEPERDKILATHGIEGADLHPDVGASLKNPRMLGIALELLQEEQIKDLDELTVSRLLFEHMRVSERDAPSPQPVHEFARKLRNHANEMLSRVDAKQRDDLKVFDGGLEVAADGRFFVPLEDDPTRYTIGKGGLTLALGLFVLDQLKIARRNNHDPAEKLNALIEPISALDQTARVLIAALIVACLDEGCHIEIRAAVLCGFAGMQNPDPEDRSAFEGLAAKHLELFIRAARHLCLAGAHQPNLDWIEVALRKVASDDDAWHLISDELKSWLTCYSLLHERGMAEIFSHPPSDPAEEAEKEGASIQDETDERLLSLSSAEQELLESLSKMDDGDPNMLARFAFILMAGKPLAPFATSLARWSFAVALNYDHAAYKRFIHLVRFNRVDWPAAREAILRECHAFERADVSSTGKWALWSMLHATGHAKEARRADTLEAELTAGQTQPEDWRLVEDYCAADPCDPNSERPENIGDTARKYAAIDVSKISARDHFFSMACPGMARFEPEVAVRKHREFIADVLRREGFALRQGLLELRHHNALLTRDDALQLVKPTDGGATDALSKGDRWVVSLYRKLLAFPHLTAQEQIEALLGQRPNDDLVLNLMDLMKPLDGEMFASLLEKACRDDDERVQHLILAFGGNTDTVISDGPRKHLSALIGSGSTSVRPQALRMIARLGDDLLIAAVAESDWSATKLGTDGYEVYEAWCGSEVILEAAARGMIPHDEALDRIAPQLYGRAAKKLDTDALKNIAGRIGASIGRAGNLAIEDLAIPDIEIAAQSDDGIGPTPYRVRERPSSSRYPIDFEAFRRSSESDEEYMERQRERQRRIREAYKAFKAELTQAEAQIILDELDIEGFDAIAASDQSLAESWYEMFMDLRKTRQKTNLMAIHNLGLLLAHALAAWDPDRAARLFSVLADSHPLVRITYGHAGISLDRMTIWSAADGPRLNPLRFERLDRAGNDHELALEVLAALRNGKEKLLKAYIEERLAIDEPAPISRALMVAGLSVENAFSTEVLARHQDVPGFICQAHAAARYAYERNVWAEHWLRQMYETEKPEDFWRYSILFTKIVDGRFEVWHTADLECGEPYRMFWPSLESRLKHRLKRWQSHRERKLFGDDVPSTVFLA